MQLAESADTTDATISRIERGRFQPSQALLARMADAIGVEASELVSKAKSSAKPSLRLCDSKLLALVKGMAEAQVDDITHALRLIIAASRRA